MNEARRLHYLDAMGIRVWRPRAAEQAPLGVDGESARQSDASAMPATETPVASAPHVDDLASSSLASAAAPAPAAASAPVPAAAPTPAVAVADAAPRDVAPEAVPPTRSDAPVESPASERWQPTPSATSAPNTTAAFALNEEPPPWSDADLDGIPMESDPDELDLALFVGTPDTPPAPDPIATMDWTTLEQTVAGCRACGLCERRHNTVFGIGDRNADLMFVGEAPGQDEDLKGEPFVGRAGQLLDRMLASVNLKREQVYIANVVKCRPPGNRNPTPDEAAACRAYLLRQIALVQPKLLVSLGGVSATNLLDTTEAVGRLRGTMHTFGPNRIPLLVTYHPSYYLRSPAEKAKGWQDLQKIIKLL